LGTTIKTNAGWVALALAASLARIVLPGTVVSQILRAAHAILGHGRASVIS